MRNRATRKLIHGNCMDFLPSYPNNHFELGFLDTQFGIGADGRNSYKKNVKQKNGKTLGIKTSYTDVRWDNEQMPQAYFDEVFRVCKRVLIFGCNYISFDQKSQSSGRFIWDKCNGKNDFSDCEIAWTNCFESVRLFRFLWNGHMQGKSLSKPTVQRGNKKLNEKKYQNTQKPIMLYQYFLQTYVKEKGLILDTHVGSGSSLIACQLEGFEYHGYEILESHYDNARIRIDEYFNNKLF